MIERQGFDARERILTALKIASKNEYNLSIRELGAKVGLRSSSTVHNHLHRLEKMGKIRMSRFQSRSIELIKDPNDVCPCCGGNGWRAELKLSQEMVSDTAGETR